MRVSSGALALVVALAAGCGSSADANPDDFVGVWTGTGTVTTKCGMGSGNTSALNETITITKGVNAPLVVVVGTCSLQMDAKGKVATLRAGQMCTVMRNGLSSNATYQTGDFTVSGIKATFNLSASFTVGEGAVVLACTYLATGQASKVPK